MAKVGRKGKFQEWLTEEGLARVESWALDGLSDKQIANNIEISQTTFYDWLKRFPEFAKAIKRGKRPVDFEVENALHKSAVGYEYEEVQTLVESLPNGTKRQKVVKVTKHVPPNPTSIIFWLSNRKPEYWSRNGAGRDADRQSENDQKLLDVLSKLDQHMMVVDEVESDQGKDDGE